MSGNRAALRVEARIYRAADKDMTMKIGTGLAAGLAAGYLLGRTRKMRLAITLATIGATGKLGVRPSEAVEQKLKELGSSEVGKIVDTVRGELFSALKDAAATAATGQVDALTGKLSGALPGADDLTGRRRHKRDERDDEDEADSHGPDEEDEDEEPDEADEEEEEEQVKRPAVRRATRSRSTSGGTAKSTSKSGRAGSGGTTRRAAPRRRSDAEDKPATRRRSTASSGRKR
jgi:hypothetical protein